MLIACARRWGVIVLGAAIAIVCGCRPTISTHVVEVPLAERVFERPAASTSVGVHERRVPGATVLRAVRYRPCDVVTNRRVEVTEVTVRRAHELTGALYFVGTGALALGSAGVALAVARPGENGPSVPLVTGLAVLSALGGAALGVAVGSSARARDTVRAMGVEEREESLATRCDEEPAGGDAIVLVDGAGTVLEEGTTDPDGRWMLFGEEAGRAVEVRLGGVPVHPVDLSGWRCDAVERDALDAIMTRADAAFAGSLRPLAHHLGKGGAERRITTPGEVHAFALTAGTIALEAPGSSSPFTPTMEGLAADAGLHVASRVSTVVPEETWPVRIAADGCYLLLVYERATSGRTATGDDG